MDLTIILDDLLGKFRLASGRLEGISLALLTVFLTYEIITEIVFKKNRTPLTLLLDNTVKYCFLYFSIINYQEVNQKLNETFIWLAGKASGSNGMDPTSMPSMIIKVGGLELRKLILNMDVFELQTYVNIFFYILGTIVLVFLALQIFITFLEYTVVTSLIIIFIPLNAFSFTKEWGSKVWSTLFSQNVKIFVLTFLTNFIMVYLNEPMGEPNFENAITYIAGLLGLVFLASKTHDVVASIFSGTPSLGGVTPKDVGNAAATGVRGAMAGQQMAQAGMQGAGLGLATGGVKGAIAGGMKGALGKANEIRASKRGN